MFLSGPKFQMDVTSMAGCRVRDVMMAAKIKPALAHIGDEALVKRTRASIDKHRVKQLAMTVLNAKYAQDSWKI